MTFQFGEDKSNSFVFTDEELKEINEMRQAYEDMTNREKFLIKEALKPYFYGKKT